MKSEVVMLYDQIPGREKGRMQLAALFDSRSMPFFRTLYIELQGSGASSNSVARLCNGLIRSGFVTRE
jgi:hypothetical protein